jgi:hypothetical protein
VRNDGSEMPVSARHANGHRSGHKAGSSDDQSKRVAQLRRAYQRQLGQHPTTIQRGLMTRAAMMTAKAEACACDPHVTLDDLVRVDHAAQRARIEMMASFERTTGVPSPFMAALMAGAE